MTGGFAQSTIDATKWLIAHHPERLRAWLEKRPPGRNLEAIARKQIAQRGAA